MLLMKKGRSLSDENWNQEVQTYMWEAERVFAFLARVTAAVFSISESINNSRARAGTMCQGTNQISVATTNTHLLLIKFDWNCLVK